MYPPNVKNKTHHMIAHWQNKFIKMWMPFSIPICLAIIIGNSIALVIFLKRNFRNKKSNYLLVNLTIADLMVGIFGIVFNVHHILSDANHGTGEVIIVVLMMIFSNSSMISLSVISFERVCAVFWPIRHRLAKNWYYFIAISIVWGLAVLNSALNIYHLSDTNHTDHEGFFFPFLILTIVSLVSISVNYSAVWLKMKYFNTFGNSRTIQESKTFSETLFIVTIISLGTWLPKTVADSIGYVYPEKYSVELSVCVTLLLYANSFLNLAVYTFRMPEFRRGFKKSFCKARQTQVSVIEASTVNKVE